MNKFKPHIVPIYPAHNELIFEEWVTENYKGCNTDRELLPVHFTSFYVNNNYGNDLDIRRELQQFLNSSDRSKKYFSIVQYDDSILEDVSHLDLLRFEMSKKIGIQLPLLCQPHPYKFISSKKWLVSFVGSRTHQVRNGIEKYINKEDWYISYEPHNIETYCRILHESIFVLCPRGYGANSFRICESLQYGAIPIYISDEFIQPFGVDFNEYGVLYKGEDISSLATMLSMMPELEIAKKQSRLKEAYEQYYTYEGCFNKIISCLEAEYITRKGREA